MKREFRRGAMEIIFDILKSMSVKPECYTHIVYKANLGGSMIPRYLLPILKGDLVQKDGFQYKLSSNGRLAFNAGSKFVNICGLLMKPEGKLYPKK